MVKSMALDSVCESSIGNGFDKIDEEDFSSSCRFDDVLSGGGEGSFVEFFRFFSLEFSKVKTISLEAIVENFQAWAVFISWRIIVGNNGMNMKGVRKCIVAGFQKHTNGKMSIVWIFTIFY